MQKYLSSVLFILLNLFLVFKIISIHHDISEINKERDKKIKPIYNACKAYNCTNFSSNNIVKLYKETAEVYKQDVYKKEFIPLSLIVAGDLFLSTFFLKEKYKNIVFVIRMVSIVAVVGLALIYLIYKVLTNFL